jgi:hypothetical protein
MWRRVRRVAGRVKCRGVRHVAGRRVRRVARRVNRRSVRRLAGRGGGRVRSVRRVIRRVVLDTVPGGNRLHGGLPGFPRPGPLVAGCTASGKE